MLRINTKVGKNWKGQIFAIFETLQLYHRKNAVISVIEYICHELQIFTVEKKTRTVVGKGFFCFVLLIMVAVLSKVLHHLVFNYVNFY